MKPAQSLSDATIYRRLLGQAKPYRLSLLAIFLLDALATPMALLLPVPLKVAVDSVLGNMPLPEILDAFLPSVISRSAWNLLLFAVILQILIVLLIQLQSLLSYFLRTKVGESMTLRFRATLFQQVQRLSLLYHDRHGTTDSIYRIQYDAPSIQWITIYGVLPLLSTALMLLSMVYVITYLNWQLALVALSILPPMYLYSSLYNRRMRPRYTETKQFESNALQVIHEVLTAIRVVKAFGREEDEIERFVHRSNKEVNAKSRLAFAEGGFGLMVNLTMALGSAAVLYLGVMGVQHGRLSLGELLMVLTYLTQLYAPVQNISKQVAVMQSSLASAQRAFELLDQRPEVAEKGDAHPIRRARGAIELREVTFGYDKKHPVLKNISFSVPTGTRVGIQGRTGAGKTTLVSLLSRFYDPQAGQILLDGMDLRDYRLADLRNQFAIMLQEPMLFSTSISENIGYARPGADFSQIMAAAKAANAHEFIVALPEGYDTLVGERGMLLSGGERQRISLARAFLKDAPILILDEPTSSIDLRTEAWIMEAMERLMQGRTVFMIAHRLSTLENCDEIMTLESGRVMTRALAAESRIKKAQVLGGHG
jgi:ATP-binding cassette subfamily B protein